MNIFVLIGNFFIYSILVLGWLFWRKNYQFRLKKETKLPECTSRSNLWIVGLEQVREQNREMTFNQRILNNLLSSTEHSSV